MAVGGGGVTGGLALLIAISGDCIPLVQWENLYNLTAPMRGTIGWTRKGQRMHRFTIRLRREKGKIIDLTRIIEVGVLVLTLGALIWSTCVNKRLINYQQDWQENTRRNEIAPVIQLTSETEFHQPSNEQVTVVFENIGKGIAQDILIWVGDSTHGIMGPIIRDFVPLGGGPWQNYIKPGEKMKFLINVVNIWGDEYSRKSKDEKMIIAIASKWTFYFSYFDIDRNEYLFVTTERPGGVRGENLNHLRGTALDSMLMSLPRVSKRLYLVSEPGSKKTIQKDLSIRSQTGFVKRELVK